MNDVDAKSNADDRAQGESTGTVLVAGAANLAIAVIKFGAGLLSGSAALLAEAVHSVADTVTEGLLLTALRRSDRPADRQHPLGYGKERFFWSLIAAVSIFVSGAVFAIVEGVRTMLENSSEQSHLAIAYGVIAISAILEGTSLRKAVKQVRADAADENRSLLAYLRHNDDPTAQTVFFEDSAALIGLAIAAGGIGLHQLTGLGLFDGLASLLIGLLLAGVAFLLGRANKALLVGRQADPTLVRAIFEHLSAAPEVEVVVDLITEVTGTDRILVCARVDLVEDLDGSEVERACIRINGELEHGFREVDEVFIEPVPRSDADLRAKVLDRYGDLGLGGRQPGEYP